MRKIKALLMTSIMVFLFVACNDTASNVSVEIEGAPEGAVLTPYDDIPNMVRATVKADEMITLEGDMLNGQRHGSWIEFSKDGPVKSITTYFNGKKHGAALKFDNNGTVTEKANYANGILDGEFKLFNRRRISQEKFYVNGNLEGVVKKYYKSGKVMEEAPYTNGKMDGLAKWYDEEGNVSIAYRYQDGELVDKDPDLEE